MEDHHVDRPGVEAQQCVKLTGTNSSIGLIVLINQCPQGRWLLGGQNPNKSRIHDFLWLYFADLVVFARGPEPDPIPNSTVKPLSADGTVS